MVAIVGRTPSTITPLGVREIATFVRRCARGIALVAPDSGTFACRSPSSPPSFLSGVRRPTRITPTATLGIAGVGAVVGQHSWRAVAMRYGAAVAFGGCLSTPNAPWVLSGDRFAQAGRGDRACGAEVLGDLNDRRAGVVPVEVVPTGACRAGLPMLSWWCDHSNGSSTCPRLRARALRKASWAKWAFRADMIRRCRSSADRDGS